MSSEGEALAAESREGPPQTSARSRPPSRPTGTVTFLFTDIEGSTRLIQELGDRYPPMLAVHREIIARSAAGQGGIPFGTEGDAVFVAFSDAPSALTAAIKAQRALRSQEWPDGLSVRVRMGIHTGEVSVVGEDYFGLALHQVARIVAAGHGGQVLVSDATRALAGAALVHGISLTDLGVHRLKDLAQAEHLFQVDDPQHPESFPVLRTLSARPNNLPVQLTSFVGRDELAEASRLLGVTHLLTLTGPGGTGKTRLALQLAADAMEAFPGGVYFVPLEAITNAELVPSAITAAIPALQAGSSPPLDRLLGWTRDRTALLVLDNFEQVVEAAPLVSQLLREAADLRIVVTSRVPLHAYGEQEFPVPALPLPDPVDATLQRAAQSEAVRLFVERAMAAQPGFRLTDENAPAVIDIVRRLDGLPLAIELAAARVRLLPLETLRARLDKRLALLVGGPRERSGRQQTLRGAIDWSYDLLDPADRRLFQRFAVFAGGAWLSAAEACCGPAEEVGRDILEGVGSLADKSLLRPVPIPADEPRFAMLATIREYANEKLEAGAEDDLLHRRHADTYASLAEGCAHHLTGVDSKAWLDRLDVDHDNMRSAIDWAVEQDQAGVAMQLANALWRFWQIRGHLAEGAERFERILGLPSQRDQPAVLRAAAEGAAGSIAYWRGDYPSTHQHYKAALELARASGDTRAIADALHNFGFAPLPGDDMNLGSAVGRPHLDEALGLYHALGDDLGQAHVHWALAIADMVARDFAGGRAHLQDSLRRNRAAGDAFGIGWDLHMLGLVDAAEGKNGDAAARFREGMDIFVRANDSGGILILLADFAILAAHRGESKRYWRLSGAVNAMRLKTGVDLVLNPIPEIEWRFPEPPMDDTIEGGFWRDGELLSTGEAIAYALEDREPASDVRN
jgi:predicted ATPase/class 3 adenylate cyclase